VLARLANSSNGVQRQMAVLSNKPANSSRAIVRVLGLGDFFVRVYGGDSFTTKKPDPQGVRTLLQETGVAAAEGLMIGDSSIDVLTGRNAGRASGTSTAAACCAATQRANSSFGCTVTVRSMPACCTPQNSAHCPT